MILVIADHDRGELDPIVLQALTCARGLDDRVDVLVCGAAGTGTVPELAAHGAATVHVAVSDALTDYAPKAAARAAAELVSRLSPVAVVAPGTPRGNEVMAHLGALLDAPMASDCVELSLDPNGHHGVVRNRWGGNLLETAVVHSPVLLATVAPHAVAAEPAAGDGVVAEFTPDLTPADTLVRVLDRVGGGGGGVGLADARVVVAGGRGVGGPDGFGPIEQLAELLGAAIGCSRVVTSAGWRPHHEQVGQTGTKVAPDLYIACGISGATQHIAGCRNSKVIVAINTDKDAPIMGYAHYAVIGDLNAVLPELVAATRAAKG
jgi:electron transfer flavoprotein alpha subunit